MSVALIEVAPVITWSLVSTSPDEVITWPVPAASAFSSPRVDTMSTSPGSVLVAIAEVLRAAVAAAGEAVAAARTKWNPAAPAASPTAATAAVTATPRLFRGRGGCGGCALQPPEPLQPLEPPGLP